MRRRTRRIQEAAGLLSLVLLLASPIVLGADGPGRTKVAAAVSRCVADEPEAARAPARKSRKRYKALFQVTDADASKWRMTLTNIRNVQSEIGRKNLDIELVVYGPGIAMLKVDSEVAGAVVDAIDSGVRVVACGNTMKGMGLTDDDMVPNIGYVKAGVVEIIQRQAQGYQYVRP